MAKTYTGEQLLNSNQIQTPKLVEPIFPKTGVVGLAGSSDTGKSTFLQQLALSLVLGEKSFLEFDLNPIHNSVIYVSTEDDPTAIGNRLSRQISERYTPDRLSKLRYIFEYDNLIDHLNEELTNQKADCVIIDAFSDVFGSGDMNQVGSVRGCINKFDVLAKRYECLFIILHHTGKRTESLTPSKDHVVGSQGFEAKMRTLLILQKDPQDTSLRHLIIAKGNYLPAELKEQTYVLQFNDNLTFTSTGEHAPFSTFSQNNSNLDSIPWRHRAIALRKNGINTREISTKLKEEGFEKCGKSTVAEFLKKTSLDLLVTDPLPNPEFDLDKLLEEINQWHEDDEYIGINDEYDNEANTI